MRYRSLFALVAMALLMVFVGTAAVVDDGSFGAGDVEIAAMVLERDVADLELVDAGGHLKVIQDRAGRDLQVIDSPMAVSVEDTGDMLEPESLTTWDSRSKAGLGEWTASLMIWGFAGLLILGLAITAGIGRLRKTSTPGPDGSSEKDTGGISRHT